MRCWMLVLTGFAVALSACSDGTKDDENNSDLNTHSKSCLDKPGTLDQPPNGKLPCELIPPGLDLSN